MIAKDRRRGVIVRMSGTLLVAALLAAPVAWGQQGRTSGGTRPAQPPAQGQAPLPANSLNQATNSGQLVPVVVPTRPEDPIALVNDEKISRKELADECVARKGQEILETLIARKLVEQAVRAKHLEVSNTEIDSEIERVAHNFGMSRENWLRTLDKEKHISPLQYARDIIYPGLALRKLASPRVQVTEQDMTDAFEAHFGDKLRCRIIMTDQLRKAQDIWERLKKNPAGFEKIAQDESIDQTSRSLGGLLGEPITRHAYPRTVSDEAFQQLVDGDPKDSDPSHKPKNGDFTGPIQISEGAWAILRREGIIPGNKNADPKDPQIRKMLHELMFEAKVNQEISKIYEELMRAAKIDNLLTGQTKLANEEQHPEHQVDGDVRLMSNPANQSPQNGRGQAQAPGTASVPATPPAGLSPEAVKKAEELKKRLKTLPAPATPASGTTPTPK